MAPRDKTACQTFPCKCKTCIFSVESDVYNKKKIQMFVVNMTFISSREVKKCIFHSCLRHSWNIHFFTSLDEIKVIFSPNIWISSIYWFCVLYVSDISVLLSQITVISKRKFMSIGVWDSEIWLYLEFKKNQVNYVPEATQWLICATLATSLLKCLSQLQQQFIYLFIYLFIYNLFICNLFIYLFWGIFFC